MMSVYCDDIGRRVVLGVDGVEAVRGSHGRLTVTYRCTCGKRGQLLTGRDRRGGGMSGHLAV